MNRFIWICWAAVLMQIVHGNAQVDTLTDEKLNNQAQITLYVSGLGSIPQNVTVLFDEKYYFNPDSINQTIIDDFKNAYGNAWKNPFISVLDDTLRSNYDYRRVVYFSFNKDMSIGNVVDSAILKFKPISKYNVEISSMKIFHLQDGKHWKKINSSLDAGEENIQITLTKNDTGFYALFGSNEEQPENSIYGVSSYPNPFDPSLRDCIISYILREDNDVEIRIFSATGEEVFVREFFAGANGGIGSTKGSYLNQIHWDGRNKKNRIVDNGGYLCKIVVKGSFVIYWKIGVLR